ncbi:hypothetical protein ACVKN3_001927 [Luteibacter sp. PvP120]
MALRSVMWLRALVASVSMIALSAHAATECEQNYSSKPSADGGTIHQSFVGLYGVDTAQAMTSLESSARKIGFQPLGEPHVAADGLITLAVAQKATVKARGFPIVMAVSPQTDSAIIAFQLAKGVGAATAMGNICSFFDSAGLKGNTTNASGKKSVANAQLALPLLGSLNGTMIDVQAAKATMAASEAASGQVAADAANARGAAPAIVDKRKVITPKSVFDPKAVDASALADGNATISGITCGVVGGQNRPAADQAITLFPYSPYLKEAIDLIDSNRYKGNKVRVDIDKRVFDTHLDGKTNSNGDFRFTRVKPGRYLVMTVFSGTATSVHNNLRSSYDPSRNTIYEWTEQEESTSSATDVLQADVTVKQDGQVVDGVVVKPMGNGRFLPVLSSVCKWHHNG